MDGAETTTDIPVHTNGSCPRCQERKRSYLVDAKIKVQAIIEGLLIERQAWTEGISRNDPELSFFYNRAIEPYGEHKNCYPELGNVIKALKLSKQIFKVSQGNGALAVLPALVRVEELKSISLISNDERLHTFLSPK
jgi:hypothetical protein